jgi:hypothetical protein
LKFVAESYSLECWLILESGLIVEIANKSQYRMKKNLAFFEGEMIASISLKNKNILP